MIDIVKLDESIARLIFATKKVAVVEDENVQHESINEKTTCQTISAMPNKFMFKSLQLLGF